MIKFNNKSNAQDWKLKVVCKNKEYCNKIVKVLLKYGMINFEVKVIECISNYENWNGRYTISMWCSWFDILKDISKDLAKIEKKLDV